MPFPAPRRFRIDSRGVLWVPSYHEGKFFRFDPATRDFREYALPTGRGDMVYALAIDAREDQFGRAPADLRTRRLDRGEWWFYAVVARILAETDDRDQQGSEGVLEAAQHPGGREHEAHQAAEPSATARSSA